MFAFEDLTDEIQHFTGQFSDLVSATLDDNDDEYMIAEENEYYDFYEFGEYNQFIDTYWAWVFNVNKTLTYDGDTNFFIPTPCLDLLSDGDDVM